MLDEKTANDLTLAFPFITQLERDYNTFMESLWIQHFDPCTVVMDESRSCTGAIFVLSGVIKIYKLSEEGKEITLYRIGRGETCVLTVACLLGSGDVPFPVAALAEQACTAAFLPFDSFHKMFYTSPALQKFIFTAMSAKFYSVLGLIENITFKRTSERLLDHLISKTAAGTYPLYVTHDVLASDLGTAREVVTRLLKELEGKQIVELSRGKIVLNPAKI